LLPGNDEIGVYYRSASTQIQRIDAIRRSTQLAIEKAIRGGRASDFRKGRRIYAEVHFYFICWHAIHERIKLVKLRSGFTLSRIYRKRRLRLCQYSTARDHLEHYLERLPGGREYSKLKWPQDLGNLIGERYSIGGDQWDVSRKSLRELQAIVRDFTVAVAREARARAADSRR